MDDLLEKDDEQHEEEEEQEEKEDEEDDDEEDEEDEEEDDEDEGEEGDDHREGDEHEVANLPSSHPSPYASPYPSPYHDSKPSRDVELCPAVSNSTQPSLNCCEILCLLSTHLPQIFHIPRPDLPPTTQGART